MKALRISESICYVYYHKNNDKLSYFSISLDLENFILHYHIFFLQFYLNSQKFMVNTHHYYSWEWTPYGPMTYTRIYTLRNLCTINGLCK